MKTIILILILLPVSSIAQWFAEPSLGFTTRMHTMPAVDVGFQSGYCEFAAVAAYEFGAKLPSYGFRTGYILEVGDYSTTTLTIQAGIAYTQNCGDKLEGGDQFTGLLGLKVGDVESRCSFLFRYIGGTIVGGFGYRL